MTDVEIKDRIRQQLASCLQSYKDNPIDLLSIGDSAAEYRYLTLQKDQYERTVRDIVTYVGHHADYSSIKVLEIRPILGNCKYCSSKTRLQGYGR